MTDKENIIDLIKQKIKIADLYLITMISILLLYLIFETLPSTIEESIKEIKNN